MWNTETTALWEAFIAKEGLTQNQDQQLRQYVELLLQTNRTTNLTRIVAIPDIISYHLRDSMRIANFIDSSQCQRVCDVGSGGGFPGVPLKIMRPELEVVLLEVNQKKIAFLHKVIDSLGLTGISVCDLDWRTFLRQHPYEIDLFLARASLSIEELLRVFKVNCYYNQATLVYWASQAWTMPENAQPFFDKEKTYHSGDALRRYIFFRRHVS